MTMAASSRAARIMCANGPTSSAGRRPVSLTACSMARVAATVRPSSMARHPDKIRTLTLTNCECEGNFPPPDFAPVIEQARQGTLAPLMAELAANPQAWPTNQMSMGYQYPDRVPQDAWRDYLTGIAGTIERARDCERLLASLDAADLEAAGGQLRALKAPTLLVWGTADTMFAVKWAYHLRDLIPGAREVIEVDGAKIFFPEERPEDLIPHLRRHWGR
jgi:pimeloyl-ACP methyl ester carboxylesterase